MLKNISAEASMLVSQTLRLFASSILPWDKYEEIQREISGEAY